MRARGRAGEVPPPGGPPGPQGSHGAGAPTTWVGVANRHAGPAIARLAPKPKGGGYVCLVGATDHDGLPDVRFQDQVGLWLEVWAADRPELREQARRRADPAADPWGYLAELGELLLIEE